LCTKFLSLGVITFLTNFVVIRAAEGLRSHPNFTDHDIENLKKLWANFVENEGAKIDQIVREDDRNHPETSYINGRVQN